MTLGSELAGHRYPGSPPRNRVRRCRRVLDHHGYWLRGPLRRNRHDNPLSRVSVTLSTESHQSRRALESVALQRFSRHREHSKEIFWIRVPGPSRLTAKGPPTRIHGFANSNTWVRQLCAKGPMRRSHPRSRQRRDERPVINPPNANGPTRTIEQHIPARSVAPNPLARVSTTLSRECQ
jgi:hypothetical protein